MEAFEAIFPMLIVIALLTVLIVLAIGIICMLKGGQFNQRYGNKLMRLRVICQGIAIILIILFVILFR